MVKIIQIVCNKHATQFIVTRCNTDTYINSPPLKILIADEAGNGEYKGLKKTLRKIRFICCCERQDGTVIRVHTLLSELCNLRQGYLISLGLKFPHL